MKILTTTAALAAALAAVKPAVPRKTTLPILHCACLEATGGDLRLTATDLETTLRTSCALHDTDREGAVAVPFQRFYKTVTALPDTDVTLSVSGEYAVTISTDAGHYQLMGRDEEAWPDLPGVGGTDVARITAQSSDLRDGLERVMFAVSQDALRPAMMGVCVEPVDDDTVRLVATDGHRLSTAVVDAESDLGGKVIIPDGAAQILLRMCKAKDRAEVVMETDVDRLVRFRAPGGVFTSVVIAETYPDWKRVMPDDNDRRLVVDRSEMLNAVKRVGLYASSVTNQTRLSITADSVTIAAEDAERSSEAEEEVICNYDGEDMEIGFNSEYLTDVLGTCEGDEVTLWLSTPNRAAIVTDDRRSKMLIMPVMLNTYA